MASEVDICNMALLAIGHTQFIAALDEDSDEASVCEISYAQCRDEVLEAAAPPFATRRVQPAALDATTLDLGAVPDGWAYAYALPADCVANGLRKIYPGSRNPRTDEEIPFVIESDGKTGQTIVLTDQDSPEFIYTAQIADTTKFSATFVRAIAERLAIECVRGLRKDPRLVSVHAQAYSSALATAIASQRRAQRPDPDPVPFFIAER